MDRIHVVEHGSGPGPVFMLHGGPGAPGSAGPLAKALGERFHVYEPWQREAGERPLSVAGHIDDLVQVIDHVSPGEPVVLVGESWGAMLSLAFTAAHGTRVRAIALVGCGTFDKTSRAMIGTTMLQRMTPELEKAIRELEASEPDPNRRFAAEHRLRDPLYTYERDPAAEVPEDVRADLPGHLESWNDMVRLQEEGLYPAAFSAIECPVLMLHGDFDPHPGASIRDGLAPHLPQLQYHEFERCGHDPLVERHARGPFLETLGDWLATQLQTGARAD